jgi:DNA-binding NtrC family response regulator
MKSYVLLSSRKEVLDTVPTGLAALRGVSLATTSEALAWVEQHPCDYLFLDVATAGPDDGGWRRLFLAFWKRRSSLRIIALTPQEQVREAVAAVESGARGYLKCPVDPDEIRLMVSSIDEDIILESELDYLRGQFWDTDALEMIRTDCEAMKRAFSLIRSVAPTRTTALLTGETGTGKSLLAKLIHRHSNRKEAQFISIHCGAIPDTLIESELFGHERGAFTGADRRKLGKFEIANGGTIFLDEVGTLTPSAQIKLLTVLQEGLFQRVGGESTLRTDVRVIAATNSDLQAMSEGGQFRKDLYYRLNVFPIHLPPLRERMADIATIAATFIDRLNALYGKAIRGLHPVVLQALKAYGWPGNIRELENVIERAYILETGTHLSPDAFPGEFFEGRDVAAEVAIPADLTLAQVRSQGVQEIERQYLKNLLRRHAGKVNQSAEEAGITPRQLHKLMKKYELHKEDFKPAHRRQPEPS